MKKRKRFTEGCVVKVPLGDGTHSYGLILPMGQVTFYDIRTDKDIEISDIISSKRLFTIGVMKFVLSPSKSVWEIVGKIELTDGHRDLPKKAIQDIMNYQNIKMYDVYTGEATPATYEEVKELEPVAGWEHEHIVERLTAHFDGRRSLMMEAESLKDPSVYLNWVHYFETKGKYLAEELGATPAQEKEGGVE
ncbi:MAG: hypothetical protein JNL32_13495 [Candidatus Kapabacteria bacterium]|nr:hypothetical protein [Candidatus Kapabacteria bacterium]